MKHVHQGYVYIWVIWLLKNAENYLTGIHVCNVMTIPCLCSVMNVTRDRPDNCRSFSFIVRLG